jgi:hypothetical protein
VNRDKTTSNRPIFMTIPQTQHDGEVNRRLVKTITSNRKNFERGASSAYATEYSRTASPIRLAIMPMETNAVNHSQQYACENAGNTPMEEHEKGDRPRGAKTGTRKRGQAPRTEPLPVFVSCFSSSEIVS